MVVSIEDIQKIPFLEFYKNQYLDYLINFQNRNHQLVLWLQKTAI